MKTTKKSTPNDKQLRVEDLIIENWKSIKQQQLLLSEQAKIKQQQIEERFQVRERATENNLYVDELFKHKWVCLISVCNLYWTEREHSQRRFTHMCMHVRESGSIAHYTTTVLPYTILLCVCERETLLRRRVLHSVILTATALYWAYDLVLLQLLQLIQPRCLCNEYLLLSLL